MYKYNTAYDNFAELECVALAKLADTVGQQAENGMSRLDIKNAHAVNGHALPDELLDIALSIHIGEQA